MPSDLDQYQVRSEPYYRAIGEEVAPLDWTEFSIS